MELKDVQEFINTNKDNEDVKTYLQGLNPITVEGMQKYLNENTDAKSWLDSEKDKHASKSLDTWKQHNLQKLIDDEVKKKFPTKDPKEIELENLKAEFEKMKSESVKKELTNKVLQTMASKKLPTELASFIVAGDGNEETTNANLDTLSKIFAAHDEAIKTEFVKGGSYTPPNDKGNLNNDKAREEVRKYMG